MLKADDAIRALNDDYRGRLVKDRQAAFITPGVAALGHEAVERIVTTVATFDYFCTRNDPHSEHDFGCFEAEGSKICFKIDYYDRQLLYHSPNPANTEITVRIITIMLASEY